jgi:hypothetical protein
LCHVPFGAGVEESQLVACFETAGTGEDREGGGVEDLLLVTFCPYQFVLVWCNEGKGFRV